MIAEAKIKENWIVCPLCGKRQFPVDSDTEINNLRYRCRSSKGVNEHFMLIEKKRGV